MQMEIEFEPKTIIRIAFHKENTSSNSCDSVINLKIHDYF